MIRMLIDRLKTAAYYTIETVFTVNSEVDEKEMQISQDCLGVPTILRHILQQFSTKELIEISLVNKLWNFEARIVMKERGNLRANISSKEDDPCQKIVAFGSVLENMRVIPFSGIYVHLHHPRACQPISDESVGSAFKSILDRLPWKYFAVNFCGEWKWKHCKDCPVRQLVATVLRDFCGVFEELSFHEGKYEFYHGILYDRMLPYLKTLRIKPGELDTTNKPLTSAFIRGLVACAPNLQDLHINGAIHFKVNVLHGSTAILAPTKALRPLFEQVCQDLINSLRVTKVQIRIQNVEMGPELLNWFLPMVLASSATALKSLYLVGLNFLVPLSHYGICFENVTTVVIQLNGERCDNFEAAISELQLPRCVSWLFPKTNHGGILHYEGCSYIWLSQSSDCPLNLKLY